jgi:MYXO-CTERM domain-containing protein
MRHLWLMLAVFLGLALQAAPASASLTYTLNCTVNPCTGSNATNNYGTVDLKTGASGHVTVTVILAANERFADLSSGYAVLWDISGSPNLTITLQGSNSGNFAVQNSGNPSLYLASPFGHNNNNCNGSNGTSCFDYAVAHNNGSGTDTSLVFDATKSGGLVLTDFATTSEGFTFAAKIFQTGNSTAFYVATNATPVAEPQTWTISVAGLIGLAGLAMLQRRRKDLARSR